MLLVMYTDINNHIIEMNPVFFSSRLEIAPNIYANCFNLWHVCMSHRLAM